jgi:hypothetical protein
MKFSNGILLVSLVIGCFLASPVTTVQASPQNEPIPNPETEAFVLNIARQRLRRSARLCRRRSCDQWGFLVTALKDPRCKANPSFSFTGMRSWRRSHANDMILPKYPFSNGSSETSSILIARCYMPFGLMIPVSLALPTSALHLRWQYHHQQQHSKIWCLRVDRQWQHGSA